MKLIKTKDTKKGKRLNNRENIEDFEGRKIEIKS